jgi:nucleoside-diphosphate-sugar epimerase
MNILVTGASGFIGEKLIQNLSADYNLFGVARHLEQNKNLFCCDLIDSIALDRIFDQNHIDLVIHSAASADISRTNNMDGYFNNVLSTLNILNICLKRKIKKFIFLSSNMVYGVSYEINIENFKTSNPKNWYSKSKFICEQMLIDQSDQIETIILRLPSVIGAGKNTKDIVHDMANSLTKNNEILIYGTGQSMRQFIYIDELIDIIEFFTTYKLKSKHLLIPVVNSELLSIKNIALKIIKNFGFGDIKFVKDKREPPDQYIDSSILQNITGISLKKNLDTYLKSLNQSNNIVG